MQPSTDGITIISKARDLSCLDGLFDATLASHFWIRARHRQLLRHLQTSGLDRSASLKGLDIGSGTGIEADLVESAKAWTVDRSDLHLGALQRNSGGRGRRLLYDVLEMDGRLRAQYDFLILFDVLEHIDDPVGFLKASAAHLKPGGVLFINVPALPFLFSGYDVAQGHHRRYTRSSLLQNVSAANLDMAVADYWGLCMVPVLAARRLLLRRTQPARTAFRLGFAPPNRAVNTIFHALLMAEMTCLRHPPLGTSVMGTARRPA